MRKQILVALVAALAIPFAGMASVVRAQDTPDAVPLNRLLRGTYSFISNATYYGLYPSIGTLTFDGKGGITGIMDMNKEGHVCADMTLNGTYVVNSRTSASGTVTLTSVSTANCANVGNGDTIALSMALGSTSEGLPVRLVNFVESDLNVAGTFYFSFGAPLAGLATLH